MQLTVNCISTLKVFALIYSHGSDGETNTFILYKTGTSKTNKKG